MTSAIHSSHPSLHRGTQPLPLPHSNTLTDKVKKTALYSLNLLVSGTTSFLYNLPYYTAKIPIEIYWTTNKVIELCSKAFFFLKPIKILLTPLAYMAKKASHVYTRFSFFITPLAIHTQLMEISTGLGYEPHEGGLCNGLACMGIQAGLVEDMDSFNGRVKKLNQLFKKNHGIIEYVIQDIKKDPSFLNECLAFFDGISLWQNPSRHSDVLLEPNTPNQNSPQHLKCVKTIIASQKLNSKKGMGVAGRFSGVYNENELIAYLNQLKKVFIKSSKTDPIAVMLTNQCHAISIIYNPKKNCWLFIDANRLPVTEESDEAALAKKLLLFVKPFSESATFLDSYKKIKPRIEISSQIYTLKNNTSKVKKNLNSWFNSKEYKSLHDTSSRKDILTDSHKTLWLTLASQEGYLDVVNSLLSNKTTPNDNDLRFSAQNGHISIVKKLLASGIKADPLSNFATPLILASINGHVNVINILIANGANIEKIFFERTPLHAAIAMNQLAAVKALLNHGANPNAGYWETPLQVASTSIQASEIVEELLKRGANPNIRFIGNFPLYEAAKHGYLKTVKALLDHGAKPDIRDYLGNTPLKIARKNGHIDIVNALKTKGAKG